MHFSKPIQTKVDEEKGTVTLSVRVTENKVEVYVIDLSEFDVMVAEYQALRRKD